MITRSMRLWLMTALSVGVALVYGAHIRTAAFVVEDLPWELGSQMRPLMALTWRLAPDSWSAHLLNVILHLVNTGLVFWLLRRLGIPEIGVWCAIGPYFLLSPTTAEAVAYAAGRSELLAALGGLTACLLATGPMSIWRWMGIGAALWMGFLGKESVVAVVFVLPWLFRAGTARVHQWVAWMGISGVMTGLILARNAGEASGISVTWDTWLLPQATAAVRLIVQSALLLVTPFDMDIDLVPRGLMVLSGGLLVLAAVAVPVLRRESRPAAVGLVLMLAVLVPRLIVQTPRSYLNAHQFYLALPGLAVMVGAAFSHRRVFDGEVQSCPVCGSEAEETNSRRSAGAGQRTSC